MSRRRGIIIFSTLALISWLATIILSIGYNLDYYLVLSKMIVFIANGLGEVFFTPYLLIVLLVLLVLFRPDFILKASNSFSEVFDEILGVKFKDRPQPEKPITTENIKETITTSKKKEDKINRVKEKIPSLFIKNY